MLSRALIVLLLVLNVGVALWWATRSTPAPAAPAEQPAGVPTLQLLRETPRAASTRPPAPAVADAAPAGSETCRAFGPFDDAAKVAAARARLQPLVTRLHVRMQADAAARDWRVWLPPRASRAAAQAMAGRIAAAGFSDYFIVANGEGANGIALGAFRSEAAARRHEAALHAAGFADVRAEPVGAADVKTWIDVAAPPSFDPEAERAALGVARAERVACASMR